MSQSIPATMTAIKIPEPGGPEALVPTSIDTPVPGNGELLVKVAAAGLNRGDIVQRMGFYPPPPGASDTPGLEVSGIVVAIGPGIAEFSVGDEICGLVAGGGYAEYCLVDAPLALPIPKPLSLIEGAALPETFFTVWTNIYDQAGLQPGETLLVHGGSSGIGTTAIMLAHAFGSRVFATAGSEEKCATCTKLGAERAINYKSEDFVAVCKDLTGGKGVDVILDMVGGDYVQRNLDLLALKGRVINVAYQNGSTVEINLMPLMIKRLAVMGSTLRARTLAEKAEIAESLRTKVWPLLDEGRMAPIVDSTFALTDAAEAHKLMETSAHIGKILLTMDA